MYIDITKLIASGKSEQLW